MPVLKHTLVWVKHGPSVEHAAWLQEELVETGEMHIVWESTGYAEIVDAALVRRDYLPSRGRCRRKPTRPTEAQEAVAVDTSKPSALGSNDKNGSKARLGTTVDNAGSHSEESKGGDSGLPTDLHLSEEPAPDAALSLSLPNKSTGDSSVHDLLEEKKKKRRRSSSKRSLKHRVPFPVEEMLIKRIRIIRKKSGKIKAKILESYAFPNIEEFPLPAEAKSFLTPSTNNAHHES